MRFLPLRSYLWGILLATSEAVAPAGPDPKFCPDGMPLDGDLGEQRQSTPAANTTTRKPLASFRSTALTLRR